MDSQEKMLGLILTFLSESELLSILESQGDNIVLKHEGGDLWSLQRPGKGTIMSSRINCLRSGVHHAFLDLPTL